MSVFFSGLIYQFFGKSSYIVWIGRCSYDTITTCFMPVDCRLTLFRDIKKCCNFAQYILHRLIVLYAWLQWQRVSAVKCTMCYSVQ